MTALPRSASRLSTIATILDGISEIMHGRRRSGALLLAAAALSSHVPGVGTVASIALRVVRRLR